MNDREYLRMYEVEDRHWWYVALHELVLEIVAAEARRHGRPLDVFDAGCGTGRLCELLARAGHRVSGCDRSGEAIRLCRRRGLTAVEQADLATFALAPDAHDVITSIDVLYHAGVADDVALLRRLARGLRPGGALVVNVVAHEFLRSTHDVAVHTRERYTRRSLCERVRAAGLEVARATYRVGLLFPLVAAHRSASRLRARRAPPEDVPSDVAMPPTAVNRLLLAVMRVENAILRRRALPVGSSAFVVARRPSAPPPGPGGLRGGGGAR